MSLRALRALRTLQAIARRGSFAAAGKAVGLTQSAVSLQVKALEDEFGAPLFAGSSCDRPRCWYRTNVEMIERYYTTLLKTTINPRMFSRLSESAQCAHHVAYLQVPDPPRIPAALFHMRRPIPE